MPRPIWGDPDRRQRVINQILRWAPLGIRRAVNQIPGAPLLLTEAGRRIYNTYQSISNTPQFQALYNSPDVKLEKDIELPDVGSASSGYEPESSNRGRVRLLTNTSSIPQTAVSSAVQGQDHPLNNRVGFQRAPRPLTRITGINYGQPGRTSVNSRMVRRIFLRGRRTGRRFRYPGTAFRRINRTWSAMSGLGRRRRLFRPERKYIDYAHYTANRATGLFFANSFVAVPSATHTPNLICINRCAQGTDHFNRIGNQITVTAIHIRGCITTPVSQAGVTTYSNCVRVILFTDRQANGSYPAINDVFELNATIDPAIAFNNLTYRSRFRILAEKKMILIGGTNANKYYYEFNVKKPIRVNYTGQGAAISDIRTNAIHLACLDDIAPGTADPDTTHVYHTNFYSRVRYIDP